LTSLKKLIFFLIHKTKKNCNKHIKSFGQLKEGYEPSYSKNPRLEKIEDLIHKLVVNVSMSTSIRDLTTQIIPLENKMLTYIGPERLKETLEKLKELKPKIERWNLEDEQYLPPNHRGQKQAPTVLTDEIIYHIEDYFEEEC